MEERGKANHIILCLLVKLDRLSMVSWLFKLTGSVPDFCLIQLN